MNKNSLISVIILALSMMVLSRTVFADSSFPGHTKESLCSGRTARVTPRTTVRVKFPSTKGMPIDLAAEKKADRMELVRNGLKHAYYSHDFANFSDYQERNFRESVILQTQPEIDYLTEHYTFRFPIETLKKVFKKDAEIYWQHFGYDHDTVTWKASKAIQDAGTMWSEYLYRSTSITETSGSNGDTVFTVSLDLNLFCQTAIPVEALVSK